MERIQCTRPAQDVIEIDIFNLRTQGVMDRISIQPPQSPNRQIVPAGGESHRTHELLKHGPHITHVLTGSVTGSTDSAVATMVWRVLALGLCLSGGAHGFVPGGAFRGRGSRPMVR